MIAQIIFFIAIALFLVIILRRAVALEKIWAVMLVAGSAIGRIVRQSFGQARTAMGDRAKQVRLPQIKMNLPRPGRHDAPNPDFWSEEGLEDKPEIMTHYDEGETLFKAGKLEEAEKFFLTAATRNPKDPKVYARLGLIYLQRKNYSDAIEALKVAVKLDKYNPTRYYNLALAYSGKNDNQRAIATIREAISLDPVSQKYRTLLEQLLNKK